MVWKKFTYKLIRDFCNRNGSRTFTLKDFYAENKELIDGFRKDSNNNQLAKIRQQLQFLRDEGLLSFVDNSGTYTLRGIDILDGEVDDEKIASLKFETPEKKEYLIETYVRDIGWAREAKKRLGLFCMCRDCRNTFMREDLTPYIEVHHIIPLCEGGEDGIWNLSVLCAHHHRMAHYADRDAQLKIKEYLQKEVQYRIGI